MTNRQYVNHTNNDGDDGGVNKLHILILSRDYYNL